MNYKYFNGTCVLRQAESACGAALEAFTPAPLPERASRSPDLPGRPSPLDHEGASGREPPRIRPRTCGFAFAPFVLVRAVRGPDDLGHVAHP